jgi:hypothetical protein
MKKIMSMAAVAITLASCSGLPSVIGQPADPAVVARIVQACQIDGVFKMLGGRLVLASVPVAGAVDAIIAAGVDRVCADPAAFAANVATAEWVAKNITAALARPHA